MDKVCLEDVKAVEKKLQALVEEKLFGPPGAWLSDRAATCQKFVDWGLVDLEDSDTDLGYEVDEGFYQLFLGLYDDMSTYLCCFSDMSGNEVMSRDELEALDKRVVENGETVEAVWQPVIQRIYREAWPEIRVDLIRTRLIDAHQMLNEYRDKSGMLVKPKAA